MKRLLVILFLLVPVHAATVTTFVAPDSFAVLQEFVASSNASLYVNAYTFDNPYIMDELIAAKNRNVSVMVLAEANPVGGLGGESKSILCEMKKSGISVYLHTGKMLLHAKYAIRDNSSVLIATENFGYDGYPKGYGNRGWGAVVHDAGIAKELLSVFADDLNKSSLFECDAASRIIYRDSKGFAGFLPKTYENQEVQLIVAPNAVEDVIAVINSANTSLYIEQFYIYRFWGTKNAQKPNAFLEAAISKARSGVEVKILLDSTWYNVEEGDIDNDDVAAYVNGIAKNGSLAMEARLADADAIGVEKIHAKGVIADDSVLISSINWNEASPTKNREVGIVIRGEAANYFRDVFSYDWNPHAPTGYNGAYHNRCYRGYNFIFQEQISLNYRHSSCCLGRKEASSSSVRSSSLYETENKTLPVLESIP